MFFLLIFHFVSKLQTIVRYQTARIDDDDDDDDDDNNNNDNDDDNDNKNNINIHNDDNNNKDHINNNVRTTLIAILITINHLP